MRWLLLLGQVYGWVLWGVGGPAWAGNQTGGHLSMQTIDNVPGRFRITVTTYIDNTAAPDKAGVILGICRRRDNLLVATFNVSETGVRQPLVFANPGCAEANRINLTEVTYETTIQLDPAVYFEPDGYYIGFQTRFRMGALTNIANPAQSGFTFYLEFPPLTRDARPFANSSPRFGPLNGDVACLNEIYTTSLAGTDPDGDELRYALVNPLSSATAAQNLATAGPYPNVTWGAGYSATKAIPGNPALSVDAQTGQLTVRPSQTGLFAFAVSVQEFRQGVKIGEVRRELQLLVVDCGPAAVPTPAVRLTGQSADVQSTTICRGKSTTLEALADPGLHYQWQQNGVNLAGQTGATLAVQTSGQYSLVVSATAVCGQSSGSQSLTVSVLGGEAAITAEGRLCAQSGQVTLRTRPDPAYGYQWLLGGVPLPNRTADSLPTAQPGLYGLTLTHKTLGCVITTEPVSLTRSAPIVATLQAAGGKTRLCPADSVALLATGGAAYQWQQNGTPVPGITGPRFVVKAPGQYMVTAVAPDGCAGTAPVVDLTGVASAPVTLDSIAPVCGTEAPPVQLLGSPAGGTYSGPGVRDAYFESLRAGLGRHVLTYTVAPVPDCPAVTASRTVVVAPLPTILLPDTLLSATGAVLTLRPALTGDPISFLWSPARDLDNPASATPRVGPLAGDSRYELTVTTAAGCTATRSVLIRLAARVLIPDAFSPNDDGVNDVWQLIGLEAYPEAVLTVYDRWGTVIYRSSAILFRPFDGQLAGTLLPAGPYPYTLYTHPERPPQRGTVLLVR
ncbi:gliding motility-associated C-terminal domain-containing protein [Spirosoma luteolum]